MIKILTTPLPATWRALNVGFTTSVNSLTTCHVVLPIQSGCVMATATTVCSSQTVATSGRILSIAPMLGTVACDTDSRVYIFVASSDSLTIDFTSRSTSGVYPLTRVLTSDGYLNLVNKVDALPLPPMVPSPPAAPPSPRQPPSEPPVVAVRYNTSHCTVSSTASVCQCAINVN